MTSGTNVAYWECLLMSVYHAAGWPDVGLAFGAQLYLRRYQSGVLISRIG